MTITNDAPVDTAILATAQRLCGPDNQPVRWAVIRSRVHGGLWEQDEALCRLVETGRLNHVKIDGTPYIWRGDELSMRVAAIPAPHPVRRTA